MNTSATAWVSVDLDAICANVSRLREYAGSAAVMAVVKGDAYGHGLVPAARAAVRGGASWLGVAQLSEALALREAGLQVPVLSWLHNPRTDFVPAVQAGVDVGVPALWALEAVVAAAREVGRPARIHLKADTGMARNGAYGPDWEPLVAAAARAQAEGSVEVVGIFSHLVASDEPGHPSIPAQTQLFTERVRSAERQRFPLEVRHLANSAGVLGLPQTHFDLVRPGLATYGLSPAPDLGDPAHFGLRPAMRLETALTLTKRVPAGQGVSYGHTYRTQAETTLVDVPIGYADGIPRHASGCGPVQVAGGRFTVAGRVCMDQFVVDVGEHPVRAGDPVVIFGDGSQGEPTAQDWADAVGTISYEIISRISSRLLRVYRGQGES
ncbi:alanine racemase [Dermacoccaceae bacterium W4C1]